MTAARTRIAPSPTGPPHVGTAYVAVFNKALALRTGGQFVLRIEDTDRARSRPEYERAILAALRWLGLTWDEGPDVGGPHGPYRQSDRLALYREHAERLVAAGRAYYCFCSPERLARLREEQRARRERIGYDGHCRGLSGPEVQAKLRAGTPHVIRLKVPRSGEITFRDEVRGEIRFPWGQVDDQVLIKADGYPTYHLANVVDDHLMGITHIIRAEEWLSSVPKHVLLYEGFRYPMPKLCHVPLLRNPDGSKISKRKNPVSLEWYRAEGFLPEALVNFLALLGYRLPWKEEVFSFERFAAHFDLYRVNPSSAPVFDLEKLRWLNGEYIRSLSREELANRLLEFGFPRERSGLLARILPLVQERLKTLKEIYPQTEYFFRDPEDYDPALLIPKKRDASFARTVLARYAAWLAEVEAPTEADYEEAVNRLAAQLGVKRGDVFMVLRVAVTGSRATPPLIPSFALLGRDVVRRRLERARERLEAAHP